MQQNADTQQLIMREAEEMELDMMKQEMANKGRVSTAHACDMWHVTCACAYAYYYMYVCMYNYICVQCACVY